MALKATECLQTPFASEGALQSRESIAADQLGQSNAGATFTDRRVRRLPRLAIAPRSERIIAPLVHNSIESQND